MKVSPTILKTGPGVGAYGVRVYKPPEGRDSIASPVDIGLSGARLHWRQDVYKGKVVDFSISIQVRNEDADTWCDIYRVDTSHGELHDHHIGSNGNERHRQVLGIIPEMGWDYVDKAWDEQLQACLTNCQARIERWRRDERVAK